MTTVETTAPYPSPAALADALPDLTGKTIAITGCTSGLGMALARTAASKGARIVMLNRPSVRSDAARDELAGDGTDVTAIACNLTSFAGVRDAAQALAAACPDGLDVLCNNAGVMAVPDVATGDGFDLQMQSNHLSHFLLTSLSWPLLERAAVAHGEARVVNHSSGARKTPKGKLQAKYLERNGGHLGGDGFPGIAKWRRYQQTKLANLLFTYALHDHIAAERPQMAGKVKALCAHPGPTETGLQGKVPASLLDRLILSRVMKSAHTTEDGAMGITRACCEEGVSSLDFFGPAGEGQPGPAVLLPQERNQAGEQLVWAESLTATGVGSFFPAG